MTHRGMGRAAVAGAMTCLFVLATSGTALANPSAPTNGGNGAGHSGQCTGAASARPASCQSP
jgi:hypothetical protein